MAAVYHGVCRACGHTGESFEDSRVAFRHDTGELQVLPPRTEKPSPGHDWKRAYAEQRIVLVKERICETCGWRGRAYAVAEDPGGLGCLVVALAGPALLWLAPMGWFAKFAFTPLAIIVPVFLFRRIHRARHRHHDAPALPASEACPSCGRPPALEPRRAEGPFPCPQCGAREYRYDCDAVS